MRLGTKNEINDYMKSTIEIFPDLDWSKLGGDASEMSKDIRREKAVEVPPPSEEPWKLITDAEVPVTLADVEVQNEEFKGADPITTPIAEEVASKTPNP